jgi:putative heme-binding domain-containing protein
MGCEGKEREVYAAIDKAAATPAERWQEAMAWIAWRLGSPDAVNDLKARAMSDKLSTPERKLMVDALAFVKSPFAALAMVDIAAVDSPVKAEAFWWVLNRQGNHWQNYALPDALKEKYVYDPEKVTVQAVVSPEQPESKLKVEEILPLKGDIARGQAAVAVCYTCHRIGSQGTDFGPDLTAFGQQQTREVILNSIINPSADIAHGFEGTHLETKDGLTIDGIVLTKEDPVLIKSIGGQTQAVPKARVKRMPPLGRSLMFSAEMLGLNQQALADIVAYLQSNAIK